MSDYHNSTGYQVLSDEFDLPSPYDLKTTIVKIDKLLNLIDVSYSLDRIFLVFDTLNILFEKIPKICTGKWSNIGNDILQSQETCEVYLINDIRTTYRNFRSRLDQDGNLRNSSFYGQTEDYPLYSTIGHQPKDGQHFDKYYQLMAHALLASHLVRATDKGNTKLKNDMEGCLETIRTFAEGQYYEDLARLPDIFMPPEQYLQHLYSINDSPKIKSLINFFRHTARGSEPILKPKHKPIRVPNQNNSKPRQRHDLFDDLADNPEPKLLEFTIYDNNLTTENEVSPQAGYDIIFLNNTPINKEENSIHKPNSLAINNKRALANQQLPTAWNNLNEHDVTCLLNYLAKPTLKSDIDGGTTKTQLNLMFWAGMTSMRIAKLIVAKKNGSNTEFIIDQYCPDYKTLRLDSNGPNLKKKLSSIAMQLTHCHQKYIDLQLPEMAIRALDDSFAKSTLSHDFLFNVNSRQIRNSCQKILRAVRQKTNSRLYVDHIQHYLQKQLSVANGNDIAGAMLTLGKDLPLGRTKIHYTSLNADYLGERYCDTCSSILKSANFRDLVINQFSTNNIGHLGTPLRPQRKPLKTLFHEIAQKLNAMRRPKNVQELIEFHNLFTAYSAWVVSFATGHRDTKSPYIPEFEFDPQTGFTITRDKDTIDFYHSRMVWVATICRRQLELYRQHLVSLKTFSTCKSTTRIAVTADRFLFLRDTLSIEEFSYKKLAEVLCDFGYELPLNTSRHFIKSELMEDGCDPDIIEIFLGHWETGLEAWGNYSSQFPYDYRNELQQYLTPLLARTGIVPLKGLMPSKIKHFLPPETVKALNSAPKKTSRKHKKNKPTLNNYNPPAQLWLKVIGKPFQNKSINNAFTTEQCIVLQKLEKHLLDVYSGTNDIEITTKDLDEFLNILKLSPQDPHKYYKRLVFLYNGLKFGKENLNWQVELFKLPLVSKKTNNRARPQMIKNLVSYRTIEKSFLNDIATNDLTSPELRIGQIILSAILFGALGHKDWTAPFLKGLGNDIYLNSNTLWIDLWDSKPETDGERFYQQNVPDKYRRWVADPFTQLLIYRWLKQYPHERKTCGSLSAPLTLQKYLTYLKLPSTPKLARLFKLASARHTVTLPPFLGAYAEKQISSASLTDESWLRFMTGEAIPTTRLTKQASPIITPTTDFASSSQYQHLKTLKSILNEKTDRIDKTIKYLDIHHGKICPILQLVSYWAITLFRKKQSGDIECRQKKELAATSINGYISAIAKHLIDACKNINPLVLDEEDLRTIYSRAIKSINDSKIDFSRICRLSQFHEFLEAYYNLPAINIFDLDENGLGKKSKRVSANYLPEDTFKKLLDNLGINNFRQIDRKSRISIVVAILSYRTGLRRSEILGLRYEDLVGTIENEIIIKSHDGRKLKTVSSQRRALIYLFLKKNEMAFIIQWLKLRGTELSPTKKGILLTSSPFLDKIIADDTLIQNLILSFKDAFTDDTTVLHHGRHTFANNSLLAQTIRTDISKKDFPQLISDSSALNDNFNINQLIKPNSKKALYVLSSLLGHADPATSMHSYIHCADWLLSHFLQHHSCAPELTPAIITKLIGCTEPRAYQIMQQEGYPLVDILNNQGKDLQSILKHSLDKQYDKSLKNNKTIINNHKPLDIILQAIKENGYLLPEHHDELDFLTSCHDKLINCKYQKRTMYINTAIVAHKTYKKRGKFIESNNVIEAKRIFKLLDFLGLPADQMVVTHHRKRERQLNYGKKQWEHKLNCTIISSTPTNTLNPNGCIRITYSKPQRWNCHFLELILLIVKDCH